ncbi:iron donor protein CyaY [Zavarzinia sp. CC-PAN008]|uniref:iron donor protein CyaY n=1 Tax=Zavarzinia sp. CC-PAN008 TaxID=3243332 RepID=UPI003F74723E
MSDESSFKTQANAVLEAWASVVDAIEDETGIEAELSDGVLSIVHPDRRTIILNRHLPSRQLWLSAPVSGAAHYARDAEGRWRSTRGPEELATVLAAELTALAGRPIAPPA